MRSKRMSKRMLRGGRMTTKSKRMLRGGLKNKKLKGKKISSLRKFEKRLKNKRTRNLRGGSFD